MEEAAAVPQRMEAAVEVHRVVAVELSNLAAEAVEMKVVRWVPMGVEDGLQLFQHIRDVRSFFVSSSYACCCALLFIKSEVCAATLETSDRLLERQDFNTTS